MKCVYFADVNVNKIYTNSNQISSVCAFELKAVQMHKQPIIQLISGKNQCLFTNYRILWNNRCNWIAPSCNRKWSKLNSSKAQVEYMFKRGRILSLLLYFAVLMWHAACDVMRKQYFPDYQHYERKHWTTTANESNKNEHILVKMPFRTMKLRFEVNSQMNWNWKVQYGFEIEIPN